jgi:septal ring factor EnvC (AmiA/AmiB activator)
VRGIVTTTTKFTEEKRYRIINRSEQDRVLLIEHPNRTNQKFRLVDTDKPVEETPEFYRFQTSLKSGETKTFTVKEERDVQTTVQLTNSSGDQIRYFLSLSQASPALKQKLGEALKLKDQWDVVRRELQQVQADLQRLNADQDRIRKNLRETPPEAEVYKKYLKKLDDQEKEIDALTARQKELMSREFEARKRYEDYLANLSDE